MKKNSCSTDCFGGCCSTLDRTEDHHRLRSRLRLRGRSRRLPTSILRTPTPATAWRTIASRTRRSRDLTSGGLKQVDSGGDIYVTFHVTSEDNTVFTTDNYGYGGWGPGWGGYGRYGYGGYGGYYGGMGTTTTRATTYTDGTLILDAYEPGDKQLVWRGTGTVTLKSKPEKVDKQIDNIFSKMGKKWQKILKNQGR